MLISMDLTPHRISLINPYRKNESYSQHAKN